MSDQVAVYNANIYPYKEVFREKEVVIPSKGHIKMARDEAVLFLGTYSPPILNADGVHMPQGYKMLKILGIGAKELVTEPDVKCNACGMKFANDSDLEAHVVATHLDQLEPEAAKEIKEKLPKGAKTARGTT